MKQTEPNPLQRELARSPLAGPHPDDDLLTAFAEGKLLQRERAEVFAHLATCPDCREVLSVATQASLIPASGTKPFLLPRSAHRPSRAWLPWASIAACILAMCSAGLLYEHRLELKHRGTVAAENAPAIPSAPAVQKETSPSAVPNVAPRKTATGPTPTKSGANSIAVQAIVQEPESQERGGLPIQPDLRQQEPQIESSSAAEVAPEVSLARPSAPASVPAPAISAFGSAAPPRAMDKPSIAAFARPHWRINSTGQAERSLGNGAWEAVLPSEKARMRVVSVFNGDVWIGGEDTRLYHSADNGSTWSLVVLPRKDGSEHSIAHIRFQTAQAGTVEAADGITWTTTDGGVSWN
ncbi:MAG: zf-HC2 domain-containing protein [Terracidiphilus sp.]